MLLTLRDIRKKKGFTQQELAAAVGATKRHFGTKKARPPEGERMDRERSDMQVALVSV